MHQTTVRFGIDLWEALEVECARLGVSAAQYLREAALARLAYTAGQRGDDGYDDALVEAGATPVGRKSSATAGEKPTEAASGARRLAEAVQVGSMEQISAARAVSAQSALVWRRAREVREQSVALRRYRNERVG
jgi:hypothetical protein